MIYSFDTYYYEGNARTACLGINDWSDGEVDFSKIEILSGIQEYESGSFYKRELPCITSILKNIHLDTDADILVVDGFVVLDDYGKLGLGGYLFEYLEHKIPIIGVAKNNFATLHHAKREVLRGNSKKPLFVTALGMDLDIAAKNIQTMHGTYRFPTVLKLLDQKSRGL
ncbi:MAG: endonuclease V [Saprospiraceae bacterium]|nr:endonuclease V [Saprospiraceae bacterium]